MHYLVRRAQCPPPPPQRHGSEDVHKTAAHRFNTPTDTNQQHHSTSGIGTPGEACQSLLVHSAQTGKQAQEGRAGVNTGEGTRARPSDQHPSQQQRPASGSAVRSMSTIPRWGRTMPRTSAGGTHMPTPPKRTCTKQRHKYGSKTIITTCMDPPYPRGSATSGTNGCCPSSPLQPYPTHTQR